MIRGIIPAAGFGTRMQMPLNKSKEMILTINDDFQEEPLIHWHLRNCWREGIEPLVLVREEKLDLINYLKYKQVEYKIVLPGKEWAETVYNSKDHWAAQNILILPDTRWQPLNALKQVKESLEFGSEVVFAVHKVEDATKWGYVDITQYSEKPNSSVKDNYAWGIIGFNKEIGEYLFKNMQRKGEHFYHKEFTNFVFLEKFEDLTRNEKN